MRDGREEFLALLTAAVEGGALRRVVFSCPRDKAGAARQSGRLCTHRGGRVLLLEAAYPGGRVSQKICPLPTVAAEAEALLLAFRQADLVTEGGQAELRISQKGKATLTGGGALRLALSGQTSFVPDVPLDRVKSHLLQGDEPFLQALGISDARGRVHDKRQAKFRQINRFLEYLSTVYSSLPETGALRVYDLCCGKSYLSFAVYHYLAVMQQRTVQMVCVDLKRDVMEDCARIATALGYDGMSFLAGDVRTTTPAERPDLVVSLHACDIATDLVLQKAVALQAGVILSTPCCHRYLSHHIQSPALAFVTGSPQLRGKLCDALTDGLRMLYLEAQGYATTATELTDPENTPKNTLLIARRRPTFDPHSPAAMAKEQAYADALHFLLGEGAPHYLEEIR